MAANLNLVSTPHTHILSHVRDIVTHHLAI